MDEARVLLTLRFHCHVSTSIRTSALLFLIANLMPEIMRVTRKKIRADQKAPSELSLIVIFFNCSWNNL